MGIFAPEVVAYHAKLNVEKGGKLLTLHVDRPDWATDEEILHDLAVKYRATTVGDIVAAMENEGKVTNCKIADRPAYHSNQRLI